MKPTATFSVIAIFVLPHLAAAGISSFFNRKDCIILLGNPRIGFADSISGCIKRGTPGQLKASDGTIVKFNTDDKCNPTVAAGSALPLDKRLDISGNCNAK
ncbi:hypothetical protein PspLS_09249 [Pyricularia sp. CBS 133598]|nr:hypothetical protein PspLS_09249 [Pyricularia sp. CBS 133598]